MTVLVAAQQTETTDSLPSRRARLAYREGLVASTAGVAPGFVQGNLAILPAEYASAFHRFCQLNPKPCPIIGMSDVGSPHIPSLGADLDIRTDVPRYRVWRDGEVVDEPTDVTKYWRDDLVTFNVDGTLGSAVAGLHDCMIQPRNATPRPVWNPDQKQTIDFRSTWQKMPDNQTYDNGFKVQWEMFIRHVVEDAPYSYTLMEGAKGVQLVECALQSWKERRWIDVPKLTV